MKFKELDKNKVSEVEKKISESFKEKDLLNESINKRNDYFVFYDGPATANGHPGLHHMLSKFLKDTFCKYKTMQGYKVLRKVGWDTHGLPVELEVEKSLGFKSKNDIEKYGIKEFNEKCRESVFKNEKTFSDLTTKMGQFIDLEHPYVTYDNNYIETEWWILKKFFDEGLFYEGVKILPFCTRCGTGLASHEVAQGYKEIDVETVYVPFKLKDEDAYFLVWTTTPWTLIANVALCVNPNMEYVLVESNGNKFILAKSLVSSVLQNANIIKTYMGTDLEYMEYEQLIPELKVSKKAFYVTCDDYVTMDSGTGIVHIAPSFGEDDANVGKKYDLPFLNPVSEDGKYNAGPWEGISVFNVDNDVIEYLKTNGKLLKKQKMSHEYPHCWRCDTPLLYYSKPSFYLKVSALKDKVIEANNNVKWYPDYVGEKRFSNWLTNMNDWAISRNRYWGTPLPLWRCQCGYDHMIGSRKELIEMAIENVDSSIDLHRPMVDDIHIKCPKCGKNMSRVADVIDCWFDSGSMPFAQYHYPFENMDLFDKQFPADFISEGIDQTRGWFYTLLIIGVFVKGVSPYKSVLVNDLIQDANGKKMSKSKGNIVEPFTTIEKYGADAIRWYLPYASPIWTPLRFDENGLIEVNSKFFGTLKSTYTFFQIYANLDNIDPREYKVKYDDLELIDKWLLSKYNALVLYVCESYDKFDLTKIVRKITEFVNDDLSNWYIRRCRRRFWESEETISKLATYQTTYEVLVGLSKLIAPIVPFISEELYINLTGGKSVHLEDFPKADESLIDNDIEEEMGLVRYLIALGRNAREEAKIKIRQPLNEIILDSKVKRIVSIMEGLIKEELNVKNITYVDDLTIYMDFIVKPNYKVAGKIFGSLIKDFNNYLQELSHDDIKNIQDGKTIEIELMGNNYSLNSEMVDITVNAKEGFNASHFNSNFIILDTTLNEELINEGIARELVSKVQQLRKTKDFSITDHINIYFESEIDIIGKLDNYIDFVKQETLSVLLIKGTNNGEIYDLNGISVKIDIERNN